MIYCSSSRALASLENLVHRSGEGLNLLFNVIEIEIPDEVKVDVTDMTQLQEDWHKFEHYPITQRMGNEWLSRMDAATVLQVPSAIIPAEHNYLLNPNHPEFAKIKIINTEEFEFDPRLKD